MLTLLIVVLILLSIGGGGWGYGRWGWRGLSPAGIVLLILAVLYFTGNLTRL